MFSKLKKIKKIKIYFFLKNKFYFLKINFIFKKKVIQKPRPENAPPRKAATGPKMFSALLAVLAKTAKNTPPRARSAHLRSNSTEGGRGGSLSTGRRKNDDEVDRRGNEEGRRTDEWFG